jgi:hypothetical protein
MGPFLSATQGAADLRVVLPALGEDDPILSIPSRSTLS